MFYTCTHITCTGYSPYYTCISIHVITYVGNQMCKSWVL